MADLELVEQGAGAIACFAAANPDQVDRQGDVVDAVVVFSILVQGLTLPHVTRAILARSADS